MREHGEIRGRTFGSDPCRTIFQRVSSLFSPGMTDNCNVNVTRLGERWIAMTETPLAIEFDPETLATLGHRRWAGSKAQGTAHPHYDFDRREAVSYSVRFGASSSYRLLATPDGETEPRRAGEGRRCREPAYMHSFALTDRYAVLFDQPLVVNPLKLALGKRSFIENYEWKPERGTRFLVIDRKTGTLRTTVEAEAFFTFHSVNAFEDGDELVVDLVAYEDSSIIDDLYLDKLRGEDAARSPRAACAATGCRSTAARLVARTSAPSRSSCRASTTAPATGATTATCTPPVSVDQGSSTSS